MTDKRIRNKERCAFRSPKMRSSVFRAKLNVHWEIVYERLVRNICENHNLVVEEQMVEDDWHETFHKLKNDGYQQSRSIRDIQIEVERENEEGLL